MRSLPLSGRAIQICLEKCTNRFDRFFRNRSDRYVECHCNRSTSRFHLIPWCNVATITCYIPTKPLTCMIPLIASLFIFETGHMHKPNRFDEYLRNRDCMFAQSEPFLPSLVQYKQGEGRFSVLVINSRPYRIGPALMITRTFVTCSFPSVEIPRRFDNLDVASRKYD